MLTSLILGAIAAAIAGTGGRNPLAAIVRFWRRAITRKVDDPGARAAGLRVVDGYEAHAAEFAAVAVARATQLGEVHRRYHATQADYERVLDTLIRELLPAQVAISDDSLAMRAALGDDQYRVILADVEAKLRKQRARRQRKAGR